MNSFKKTITIFVFLFLFQISFADCGHCFSIIKVKIIYNNGNTENSNLMFFRQQVLDNNEITPKPNEKIKHYFSKSTKTIELIDTIYEIEKLPPFIDKKNTRNISFNDIKDILLLEWTNIGGAFELPYLSSESIEKVMQSNTVFVNSKTFHVHDEFYINTENKLSREDFNLLINESYNEAELEPSMIGRLNINKRKNIYPNKTKLNDAFGYYFNRIDIKIKSISKIKINNEINEYFEIYNKNLKQRKEYLKLVFYYLNSSDPCLLEDFILNNLKYENTRKMILDEINYERDIIKNVIALIEYLQVFGEDQILMDKFYKILKKENIIVLSWSWD